MLRLKTPRRHLLVIAGVLALAGLVVGAASAAGGGAWLPRADGVRQLAPAVEQSRPPVARVAEPLPTPPATTERVSVGDNENQGNGGSGGVTDLVDQSNGDQAISADGRWVAFVSTATNLIPGTDMAPGRLYLRDRQNGTTTAIPFFGRGGIWPPNIVAAEPSISADGSVVAFTAIAAGITGGIAGPTGPTPYVLAWDRLTNTTTIVSIDSQGAAIPGFQPSVSGDGRYVAYTQWGPAPTPTPSPTAPPDTTAPILSNLEAEGDFQCISTGGSQRIFVAATDPGGGVQGVTLSYTPVNGSTTNVAMTFNAGINRWEGRITVQPSWGGANHGFVDYFVRGTDFSGNVSAPLRPTDGERVFYSSTGCIL